MSSLEEKRVYGDRAGHTEVALATDVGAATVRVAADRVGEFGVVHRCDARDVAARDGRLAVAAAEDAFLEADRDGAETFDGTGFGAATAVGFDGDALLVGGPDGRVARRRDGEWTTLGDAAGAVRAVDRGFVAGAAGLFAVPADGESLRRLGLDDARDVAALPDGAYVATGDGLHRYAGGRSADGDGTFERLLPGEFDAVAAHVADGALVRAHAAGPDGPVGRGAGDPAADDWHATPAPVETPFGGIAYRRDGGAVYAATREGTFLVDAGEGWRDRTLGLAPVGGVAVR